MTEGKRVSSMLRYILEMNRLGLIEDSSNYTPSAKATELLEEGFSNQLVENNLKKWVDESFAVMGKTTRVDQKDFLQALTTSFYRNETITAWAKKIGEETYSDPQVYLAALAVMVKDSAKRMGIVRQTGSRVAKTEDNRSSSTA